ncbi:hypothetical protein HKI87_01g02340 [Chloropicon roscoffensis]|uniref:F-box domain-containing protein n=1 Tax=Chloropicon roscoffensis TaxID=1461544 RepID=A0AAX4NXS6_9CHLO
MDSGEGEVMANRAARVDEADEKEDPVVRRREGLVQEAMEEAERLIREAKEQAERLIREVRGRGRGRLRRLLRAKYKARCLKREAKAEGERLVREAILESDRTLSEARQLSRADLEAKNEERLRRLPPELWQKILDENLDQNDLVALALTCRFFREKQKDLGKKLETNFFDDRLLDLRKSGKMAPHTLGWFRWVCDTFEILPGEPPHMRSWGAVYEGNLVSYAAFQGNVEILKWMMEEKGWEPTMRTHFWAGRGGSIEVFVYLKFMGYGLNKSVCFGAAEGGNVEALKFLRGLDPPCPWGFEICTTAASNGHLEVLKWARAQDPPCPWTEWACNAAAREGHLEVLKWLRAQNPPCPWSRYRCKRARSTFFAMCGASECDYQHINDWIDQQEDHEGDEDIDWGYSD